MFQGHTRAALGQTLGAAASENEPELHLPEESSYFVALIGILLLRGRSAGWKVAVKV